MSLAGCRAPGAAAFFPDIVRPVTPRRAAAA